MNEKNMKKNKNMLKKRRGTGTSGGKLFLGAILLLVLLIGAVFVLGGGGASKEVDTAGLNLPYYAKINSAVMSAYVYAAKHPKILEKIPCYCSCGEHSGHLSLKDCFLTTDGYNPHASSCDVCVGSANDVNNWLAGGVTLKESRDRIDARYSGRQGYIPTDTGPVMPEDEKLLVTG